MFPVFELAVTVTVPELLPEEGLTLIQLRLSLVVQLTVPPPAFETLTLPEPPEEPNDRLVGVAANKGGAADWLTDTVLLP